MIYIVITYYKPDGSTIGIHSIYHNKDNAIKCKEKIEREDNMIGVEIKEMELSDPCEEKYAPWCDLCCDFHPPVY